MLKLFAILKFVQARKAYSKSRIKKVGFTLIELAIVLVIIGLLVGGVLVGKDLIKASEIRAQIQQIEKYNGAVNTFRTKYNGLPGDLKYTDAQAFGFFSDGMNGTAALGDGNGLITDTWKISFPNNPSYGTPYNESMVFWRHLSDANLIDGQYGSTLASRGVPPSNQSASQVSLWLPATKLSVGNIAIYTKAGNNFYQIERFIDFGGWSLSTNPNSGEHVAPSVTPIEAQSIDSKMDDGMPQSGNVLALSGNDSYDLGHVVVPSDHCTTGASPDAYDIGATYGNSTNCSVSFKFQ